MVLILVLNIGDDCIDDNDCNLDDGNCLENCSCFNYICVSENVDSCAVELEPPIIDPSAPYVDLNRVFEDPDGRYILKFGNYSNILFNDLPGCLKYIEHDDTEIKLNVVSRISSGSYGIVLKYSQETPLPYGWTEVKNGNITSYIKDGQIVRDRPIRSEDIRKIKSVAVKVFSEDPTIDFPHGQNDPEIAIIRHLSSLKDYNCNTVQSRIIDLINMKHTRKNVALMEIMDGTLDDLYNNPKYNEYKDGNKLRINVLLDILIQLAIIYKCLLDLGYYYNDSKGINTLFKIDRNGRILVRLGDLGSIRNSVDFLLSTYPPPEYMYSRIQNINGIVWGFGTIILQLYGIQLKWIHFSSNYPNEDPHFPDVRKETIEEYYANLNGVVIPGLNITDPKIQYIVGEIFKDNRTITFDAIIDRLTDCELGNTFSETGLNPCEPCTICSEKQNQTQSCTRTTDTICIDKSCNRIDFCNNRGETVEQDGKKYPDCEPCNCEGLWGGKECEILLHACSDGTYSSTGFQSSNDQGEIIDCERCEICTTLQKEIQACTRTTNRRCIDKSCNSIDFCNNRGETVEQDGEQYPNCEPCNCEEGWGGINCEIRLPICSNETYSSTGFKSLDGQGNIIDCERCKICTTLQKETQACTRTTNRRCINKSCNRSDFCNDHGTTLGPRDGEQYPNCEPCECDVGWGGDNCEIFTTDCDNDLSLWSKPLCEAAGCKWDDYADDYTRPCGFP